MANPYKDVIDWLRSPAGERWSEMRLWRARMANDRPNSIVDYSDIASPRGPVTMSGMFSIKG